MPITHAKVSAKSDGADTSVVRPSDWNAAHVGGYEVVNVRSDYGAVGNGSTDDTTAINNAIAALNSATKGVLYFPTGEYKVTAALTTITFEGQVQGDGCSLAYGSVWRGSCITSTSASATVFSTNTGNVMFQDLSIRSSATTPTTSIGVQVAGSSTLTSVSFRNCTINHFNECIDIATGQCWSIIDCHISDAYQYNIHIRDINNADAGDWTIMGNEIGYSPSGVTASAIRVESAGGCKIIGNKFNGGTNGTTYLIDMALGTNVQSGEVLIMGNSMEAWKTNAVRMTTAAAPSTWSRGVIANNTMRPFANTSSTSAISMVGTTAGDFHSWAITGNVSYRDASSTSYFLTLTNCTRFVITGNLYYNYASGILTGSGQTDINQASNYT